MKIKTTTLLASMLLSLSVKAQVVSPDTAFAPFERLAGNWVADRTGDPSEGTAGFTFQFDLNKHVLISKYHKEFPPTEHKEKAVHEEMMVIYTNSYGHPDKAVVFDNEGHTTHFNVEVPDSGDVIALTAEPVKKMPQLRTTYWFMDRNTILVQYQLADAKNEGEFRIFLEEKFRKH